MTCYEPNPSIGELTRGATHAIAVGVQDASGNALDLTGATISVRFEPADGDNFDVSAVLDGDPAAVPQFTVTIESNDTPSLNVPNRVQAYCEIDLGGSPAVKHCPRFHFELVKGIEP